MPNNHIQESQYHEYLDEALAGSKRNKFEAHISACQVCRQKLADLRQLFLMIESVPETNLQVDLTENIYSAIGQPARVSKRWKLAISIQLAVALTLTVIAWPILGAWEEYYEIPSINLDINPYITELSTQIILHSINLSLNFNTLLENVGVSLIQFQVEEFGVLILPLAISATLLWLFGNKILLGSSSLIKR